MYNNAVTTTNLSKQYGRQMVLNNVSIQVKPGQIYGLVGNNGAGKTTLLRILSGLTIEKSGEYTIFDESEYSKKNEARRRVASLIEEPGFFPFMTARQNLEYFRIQRGIPGKEIVDEVLKEVGLDKVGKKKFGKFSLGMRQRLGIALALMGEPELLLLYEQINGLDPEGIIDIRNIILKVNREKNTTIVISSHILPELSNIATYYGFLKKGELVEQISAEELSEKCETYLEMIVSDVSKAVIILEKQLGITNYKILPGNVINIYDRIDDGELVSREIVTNGIGLKSLYLKSVNLEKYYMSLMGEE